MKTKLKTGLAVMATMMVGSMALAASAPKMTCTLTGKQLSKCCCVEKAGKKICTLTGKTIEKCCCKEVK